MAVLTFHPVLASATCAAQNITTAIVMTITIITTIIMVIVIVMIKLHASQG